MRSPVTAVIQSFNALTEDEKKLCLDFIAPEPEPEPQVKQTRKTRKRAEPLSDERRQAVHKRGLPQSNGQLCTAMVPGLNVECGNLEDNGIHDPNGGYGGYHPFESSAPVVERKSRRKAAAASSTQSSETGAGAALSAGS